MKHPDPLRLAEIADGAEAGAAERGHLRRCRACAGELAALRALTADLTAAPPPPRGLHGRTLRRLGLRPRRGAGWLRWAGIAGLGAAAAALLLLIPPAAPPSRPPGKAALPSPEARVPTLAMAPRPAAPVRPVPAVASDAPREAPRTAAVPAPRTEAPAAAGAVPEPKPQMGLKLGGPEVQPGPTPPPAFTVAVEDNLIRPGRTLRLRLSLPQSGLLRAVVLDARGRPVARLFDGPAGPGGVALAWDGQGAPSGAYTVLLLHNGARRELRCLVAR